MITYFGIASIFAGLFAIIVICSWMWNISHLLWLTATGADKMKYSHGSMRFPLLIFMLLDKRSREKGWDKLREDEEEIGATPKERYMHLLGTHLGWFMILLVVLMLALAWPLFVFSLPSLVSEIRRYKRRSKCS